jgi:hypothetical protein
MLNKKENNQLKDEYELWIRDFHNIRIKKDDKGNILLTKEDVETIFRISNMIHKQAREEQFYSPQLQGLIALIEMFKF